MQVIQASPANSITIILSNIKDESVDDDDECMQVKQAAPANAHRILIIVKFYFAILFLKFNISKSCNWPQSESFVSSDRSSYSDDGLV